VIQSLVTGVLRSNQVYSLGGGMAFNSIFNNISFISWRSVLLVKGIWVPVENHRPATSHWQTLSHNAVSSTPRLSGIRTHNSSGDRSLHETKHSNFICCWFR